MTTLHTFIKHIETHDNTLTFLLYQTLFKRITMRLEFMKVNVAFHKHHLSLDVLALHN